MDTNLLNSAMINAAVEAGLPLPLLVKSYKMFLDVGVQQFKKIQKYSFDFGIFSV